MTDYNWEGKIILVAEDVLINFKLLELNLKKTNATIIWAKDGEEVVEYASKNKVDLILMDIQMPKLNGYDATRLIRETNKVVPIIAQTAFTMTNERDSSIEAGCNAYITKPINRIELLSTIHKYLGFDE